MKEHQLSSYHNFFLCRLPPKAPTQEKRHQKYRKVLPKLQLLRWVEVFLTTIKIIFLGFNLWMLLPNVCGQEAKRYEMQISFLPIALYIWQPIHVGGKEVVFMHPLWQQNHSEFYLVGIFVISSAYQFDHSSEFTHLVKLITELWSEFHSLPLDQISTSRIPPLVISMKNIYIFIYIKKAANCSTQRRLFLFA